MSAFFWCSVAFIAYAYAGYPVLLWILSFFGKTWLGNKIACTLPTVSLVISAYNEERSIENKILNCLELDYPHDMLEIVVVSDASTDNTERIVLQHSDPRIKLMRFEGHIGKTACLNKAVPLAVGEIVVFSDANSQYDKAAIRHLAGWFKDKTVGFVTGRTEYVSRQGTDSHSSTGLYSRIERCVKRLESEIGSCVGADGAIFAIRKSLYPILRDYDINDFVIPLKIIEQGFRGLLDEAAYCTEESAGSAENEFRRHVRITTRSLRAIFSNSGLMNPFRHPLFAFQLVSHKLIRFLSPPAIFLSFFFNALIVLPGGGIFYVATLAFQILLYILWGLGYLKIRIPLICKAASFPNTFFMINLAILIGWIKYLQGETFTTWNTHRESMPEDIMRTIEADPMLKKKEIARS